MPRPPELAQVAALGLIQGATELLPVSSSAHVAAVPRLLGWDVAAWAPARRKELEVALHVGALVALAPSLWRVRPDARTLVLSLAPPVVARLRARAADRGAPRRPGWRARARRCRCGAARARGAAERSRPARGRDGRAGAAASRRRGAARPTRLRGCVGCRTDSADTGGARARGGAGGRALARRSRTGATLAAARALGHSRAEASRLSFGVAGPVLAGATALKAWRGRSDADRASSRPARRRASPAPRRAAGLRARAARPLWPYAAERALLAGAILVLRYRRAR